MKTPFCASLEFVMMPLFIFSSIPPGPHGLSFHPMAQARELRPRAGRTCQEPLAVSGGAERGPTAPLHHWLLSTSVSLGGRSLPGAHLIGAQLSCELAEAQEGKVAQARRGRGGVFPLAGWSPSADTAPPTPPRPPPPVRYIKSLPLPLFALEMAANPTLAASRT